MAIQQVGGRSAWLSDFGEELVTVMGSFDWKSLCGNFATQVRWILAATFFASSLLSANAQEPSKRPNVLVIVTDDQRFDLLGCAGHPILKTPHIDSLAKKGIRFRNMFATTPICAASRASILTGLYERTHKFTFKTPPIAAEFCAISYPALLRQAGYRTGLIGKFGVGVAKGQEAAMFDRLHRVDWPFQRALPTGEVRHIDQIATDIAINFLRESKGPFCLSVCFNSPHAEDYKLANLYPSPKTVEGLYDDVAIPDPPLVDEKYFRALPDFLQTSLNRKRWYWQFDTPEKYQKNVRSYFRMISGLDFEIGRLLEELKKLGLDDNTIIVFTSDNGYFLNERGLSGKWNHFEESLRVPLIVYDPRLPADRGGRTSDAIALNLDLAPSILEWAGIASTKKHHGRSLGPLVRGEPAPDWRSDFFGEHLFDNAEIPKWEGVHGERYVYANYFEQKPPFEFLHDLKDDPQQTRNLATDPAHAATLRTMRDRAIQLRDSHGGPYSPDRFPTASKKTASKK